MPPSPPDPQSPDMFVEGTSGNLQEDQAVVWWIVTFVGLFQALHSITDRATNWLIRFLSVLLKCLAILSRCQRIKRICSLFPSSFYRFKQYLTNRCGPNDITKYVVCPKCDTLYSFDECFEKRGVTVYTYTSKMCSHCEFGRKACGQELLRKVVSGPSHPRVYPHKVYYYSAITSTLQRFFCRPGFFDLIESTRVAHTDTIIRDVFQGQIWKDFLMYGGQPFLCAPLCYAMVLNIDWFEAYEHYKYKVGVIYLALLNLPRNIRYKRENIILVGIIPGPGEPSIHINTYLAPLVNELLKLWEGVTVKINGAPKVIRVALLCVACDTPAARKVSGFLSHSANLGCQRCYCEFSEGGLARNRSNFDRNTWERRTNAKHREDVKKLFSYTTKTSRAEQELKLGCRFSALLNLPYFDPVRMTIIDGMHNIFLGSANYFIRKILIATDILDKQKLQLVHNRMKRLQLPCDIGRLPSKFDSGATFTAEQWMNWTLYFSVFCFYRVLNNRQLECWRHLVLASRRLCKRSLKLIDITVSDLLLLRFGKQVCDLFGYRFVTPNMHMHCHLAECLKDYGPLHAFWLFSFERYNGLLGNQPNNNHAIELQLLNRFNNDNLRLDLVHHFETMPFADLFSESTVVYASNFNSIKPTQLLPDSHENATFTEPPKHSLFVLTESLLTDLRSMYANLLPDYATQIENGIIELQSTCRKYSHVFMNGKKLTTSEQEVPYVLAIPPLESSDVARPFRMEYFIKHSVLLPMSETSSTFLFAVGRWPQQHPRQHMMGKPVEVWCLSTYESALNSFVPVSSIQGRAIVATECVDDEDVLVIIPLVD